MDDLKWKTHEYQYCSTHQDLHFIYRPFLHLTKCWQSVLQNPHQDFTIILHIMLQLYYTRCQVQITTIIKLAQW